MAKLKNLFDKTIKNKVELEQKRIPNDILAFFKQGKSSFAIVYDSEYIVKSSDGGSGSKTTRKGDKIKDSVSIDHSGIINIPDEFIPFLETQILFILPEDCEISLYKPYPEYEYQGTYTEVYGDLTLLLKTNLASVSSGFINTNGTVFTSEEISSMGVGLANTKTAWICDINQTGLEDLITIQHKSKTGDSLGSTRTTFTCNKNTDKHEFLEVSDTSFHAIGEEIIEELQDLGGDDPEWVIIETNDPVERTKAFADANISYIISTTNSDHNGVDITSATFSIQGRMLYYSDYTGHENRINVAINGTLSNLNTDVLDYTEINLKRNNLPLQETHEENIISETDTIGISSITKEFGLFKIKDDSYYFKYDSTFQIATPAIIDDPDPDILIRDAHYTDTGGESYVKTSEDLSYISEAFVSEKTDIKYRLFIILKNPLLYKEIRNYDAI